MSRISDLQRALRSVDAPVIQVLRPGLSAEQVRDVVSRLCPVLMSAVDEVVEEWWSWHDGPDSSALLDMNAGVSMTTCNRLDPYGLAINQLDQLLDIHGHRFGPDMLELDGGQVFPVSMDRGGGLFCLYRRDLGDPWAVWWLDPSSAELRALLPRDHAGVAANPTFDSYLAELAAAIRSGRMVAGEHGGMVFGANLQFFDYPWR